MPAPLNVSTRRLRNPGVARRREARQIVRMRLNASLAVCKKGMGPTVITPDVVSSVFASRECGLLLGDAREVLRTLADDSVDCPVTRPPYYSGRRHVGDTIHEIGSEKTVEEYVEALAFVGREVYRVTRPTGSYW